jgi:superfamily II DNA helicase RecQ
MYALNPFMGWHCIHSQVHCASEWAHNFRPSYLRLGRALKSRLRVPCILGLTATATMEMISSVTALLDIPPEGVIRTSLLRPNLRLSASEVAGWGSGDDLEVNDAGVDQLKIFLERFHKGVIVYCRLQRTCTRLATALGAMGFQVAAYHAGKSPRSDAFFSCLDKGRPKPSTLHPTPYILHQEWETRSEARSS